MTTRPTAPEVPEGCPYQILEQIGRGGMAVVYRAKHSAGGNDVALKLHLPLADNTEERMRREIAVQRKLSHEAIMPILEYSENVDADPWFTMPMAAGSLKDLQHQVAAEDVQELMVCLAEGMEYAHEQGFIHRDISPRNILLLPDRGWVIADWGTVRRPLGQTVEQLTTTAGNFGTLAFAAPEMQSASAHLAGPEADVYSLGRVVAWLLTGEEPQMNLPLHPEGPWRGVVVEATAIDRTRRCRSMRTFIDLMENLLGDLPGSESDRLSESLEGVAWSPTPQHPSWKAALSLMDDYDVMVDVVARIDERATRSWAQLAPQEAATLALRMSMHLLVGDFGKRSFNYLNVPLGWIFDVMRGLASRPAVNELEDVAHQFFIASKFWDRYPQNNRTASWLRTLSGGPASAVATGLRRSRTATYHAAIVEPTSVLSPEIAAVLRAANG